MVKAWWGEACSTHGWSKATPQAISKVSLQSSEPSARPGRPKLSALSSQSTKLRTQTVPQGLGETFQRKTSAHAYSSMGDMSQHPLEMTAELFAIA